MDVQNLFSNADNMALQQDAKPYFICCDFFLFSCDVLLYDDAAKMTANITPVNTSSLTKANEMT